MPRSDRAFRALARHMAVVAAAMRGRYDAMLKAMEDASVEPVIIEDLVRFGEDRGIEKGRKEGREEGREEGRKKGRREEGRANLRRVLARRNLALTPEQEQRIDACASPKTLGRWIEQAVFATTAAEALK